MQSNTYKKIKIKDEKTKKKNNSENTVDLTKIKTFADLVKEINR